MRDKSALFLMEILIAVIVFAFCAAVCVWFFAESYIISNEAKDLSNALVAAKNEAETFKATGVTREIYYDKSWQTCEQEAAAYVLNIEEADDGYSLSVSRLEDKEILEFPIKPRSVVQA